MLKNIRIKYFWEGDDDDDDDDEVILVITSIWHVKKKKIKIKNFKILPDNTSVPTAIFG